MKTGWEGMSRLVRNVFSIEKLSYSGSNSKKDLPARMIAQAEEIRGNRAILLWKGQKFWAKLDVPVEKGEYLLLKYEGMVEGKHYYKIMERSFNQGFLEEKSQAGYNFIIYNSKGIPIPVMFRYKNNLEESKKKRKKTRHSDYIAFDFIVETKNLGSIIVRIEKKSGIFSGRILVEHEKILSLLQEHLGELQSLIFQMIFKEIQIEIEMFECRVMTWQEKEDMNNIFLKRSFGLDERV